MKKTNFTLIKYLFLSIGMMFGLQTATAQCGVCEVEVSVTMSGETFAGENSWVLWDATAGASLACVNSNTFNGFGGVSWVNGSTLTACAPVGNSMEVHVYESFGDGWQGGTLTVAFSEDGSVNNCPNSDPIASIGPGAQSDNDLTAGFGDGGIPCNAATLPGVIGAAFIVPDVTPTANCTLSPTVNIAGGTGTVLLADIDDGTSCGITSIPATTFTCADVGTQMVTMTSVDCNGGNPATCNATVTVAAPPVNAVCSPGITLTLAGGTATLTPAMVDGGSTAPCGTTELMLDQEEFTCDDVSPVNVTLTVTDSQTGAIATCTTPVTLVVDPPTMVCSPFTVTLDASGNATITGADVDGGSTAACGDPILSVAPSAFTCADVGVQTVTLTGADPSSGQTATCDAMVTVLGSQFCVNEGFVNISNDDPLIADPCTCDGFGGFDEELLVDGIGAGEMWEVLSVTGLTYGSGGAPVMAGDLLTDLGDGNYVLNGVNHLDAVGYQISVVSPSFPGVRLTVQNTCFYPLIIIDVPFDTVACEFTEAIPLIGQGVSQLDGTTPVDGVGMFTVNGVPATELNPLDLGTGTHTVEFCFDAGEALGFTTIRRSTTSFPPDEKPFAQNKRGAMLDPGCQVCQTNQFVILGTPSSIACNDRINVSLEGNCEALITPDMVLEGSYVCFDDYEVTLKYNNNVVANPVDY